MKKLGLLAAALVASSASFAATTTVNGGTVHFVGELINAACAVSTDTADQTVDLGQHRTASLAVANTDKSTKVPFNIQLVDCDSTVATTAQFAFSGQTVTGNKQLLAVNSGGSNAPAATNVGIAINDAEDTQLAVDGTGFSVAKPILNGTNTYAFTAQYVATGASTPGKADADATFVVQYN